MRSRRPCWSTSAPFRCEWRPSRWQAGAMCLLGLLAAGALVMAMLGWGAWWLAVRQGGRVPDTPEHGENYEPLDEL